MTPEQRAIRQWLSKPYPTSSACACLGPLSHGESSITIHASRAKFITMKILVNYLSKYASMGELEEFVNGKPIKQSSWWIDEYLFKQLSSTLLNNGVTLTYVPLTYDPVCACAMAFVEEVDGSYYKISEHRSPDGVTHTAKLLGPVGGPYVSDR